MKQKTEDYKISAVKYYLKNNVSLDDVSKIFNCPKQLLYRWIDRYKKLKQYLKLNKKVLKYEELKEEIKKAIKNIKKEFYFK